jgi:ribonuclease P protein component
VCSNTAGVARLGLAVAARVAGNAVSRNRIRRIVRESFRLCQGELPAVDIVISARGGARSAPGPALRADIDRLFAALTRPCARS